MKSMLQEASSIYKAIEKAWNGAGKPQEFTIKILEKGDKNFLGMTTRPAVVSITFSPKKQLRQVKEFIGKKKEIRVVEKIKRTPGIIESLFGRVKPKKIEKKPRHHPEVVQKEEQVAFWKKEFIGQVIAWLKEMIQIMGIRVNIDIRPDQRILNVYLDKRLLKDAEEEKLFFISISHLLMQFLKRKFRKKFINYYLIIHTKTVGANGDKKGSFTDK